MLSAVEIPGIAGTFTPHEEWTPREFPISGAGYFAPKYQADKVNHVRIHYTAADNLPDYDPGETWADVLEHLYTSQSYYRRVRGYSLGYSWIVDRLGNVIEGRGWDYRTAANNGDKGAYDDINLNTYTFTILCLVDGKDSLSEPMKQSIRAICREGKRRSIAAGSIWGNPWNRSYPADRPFPHRESDYTLCCGDGIVADINNGDLDYGQPEPKPVPEPVPPVPTPPDEKDSDMLTMWRHPAYREVFLIGGAPAINVTPDIAERYSVAGVPTIVEAHDGMLQSCLFQSGLSELTPV